jgi:hypothetical protein
LCGASVDAKILPLPLRGIHGLVDENEAAYLAVGRRVIHVPLSIVGWRIPIEKY